MSADNHRGQEVKTFHKQAGYMRAMISSHINDYISCKRGGSIYVVTCFGDQDIGDAARIMEECKIRRLLVLNHDNSIAGFLSVDDLVNGSYELAGAVLEAATPIH